MNEEKRIFVTQPYLPSLEEYVSELQDIWASHWLTNMGEKHQALQRALRAYLGVPSVELFTNGHMSLELSLQALGLTGEVITTPFTFASTTHAILRSGLTPVFCDIEPETYTIDVTKIERLITKDTCAILPVHVYGHICDVEAIDRIAKEHGLKVIYDAAHAFGETYRSRGVASFGDVACFSFHATKVYHTIEGGAACCDPARVGKDFGRQLYLLKDFGISAPEKVEAVGANAKMNEFCAAMGLCNLRHVDEEIAHRKEIAEIYRAYLDGVPGIKLSPAQENVVPNYAYFPVVFDEKRFGASRDDVAERLAEHQIYARKYFYPATNAFDVFRGVYDAGKTPVAKDVSEHVLTLPMYGALAGEEAERIAQVVLAAGSTRIKGRT